MCWGWRRDNHCKQIMPPTHSANQPIPMLDIPLYGLVIRAILNEDGQLETANACSGRGKKASNRRGGDSGTTLGLAEKFRQLADTVGPEEQQRLIDQHQNWIAYSLDGLSVQSPQQQVTDCRPNNGFILQIVSGEEREEHFLRANELPLRITLPHGRHSLLRLFSAPEVRKCVANVPMDRLQPSSTSSSSTPSLASAEGQTANFGLNSLLATKSGSFLRRLARGSAGRGPPLLVVRFRTLATDQQQNLPIGTNSLHFTLRRHPANSAMELPDFVTVLRAFKVIFLQRWVRSETAKASAVDTDGETNDDLAKAFRHFNEMTETAESARKTLAEVTRRVARFNGFSLLAQALLEIGVNLEQCSFDDADEGDQLAIKRLELARASIGQHWVTLTRERIGCEQELKAAVFLAERLIELMAEATRELRRKRLLVPALFSRSSQFSLGQSLTSHLAKFEQFTDQLGILLNLVQCSLWEHPGVSGLSASVSRHFDQSLQQQLAQLVRNDLHEAKSELDSLGDFVDSLRLFLLHTGAQRVERLLEHLWLPFAARLVQTVDDPLCLACQSLLRSSTRVLNPRDIEQTIQFTRATMRLFDAFKQLSEMTRQFGDCCLHQFEPWFETAVIHWTGTWRSVYVGFVRKCVEECAVDGSSVSALSECSQGDQQAPFFLQPLCGQGSPPSSPLPANSPPRLSRQFVLADFTRRDLQLHEATVNCLAFCKALCDDFLRLGARNPSILLLGTLQVASILADCLTTFCSMLLQQLKAKPRVGQMVRAANGIGSGMKIAYLAQNFERFLDIQRMSGLLEEAEKDQAIVSIRHIFDCARKRCRVVADQIVMSLCERRGARIRQCCAMVTSNWEDLNAKKPLRCYLRQVLLNERAEQLLQFLDKCCAQLHSSLLPRLYASARLALWQIVRRVLELQLLRGQPPAYYAQVEKACESVCQILLLDWAEEHSRGSPFSSFLPGCENVVSHLLALRRLVHANKASTRELILQYYANLAEQSTSGPRPERPTPRVCFRLGHVRTTGQQILLHIQVVSAFDVPVLDTLTHSTDPYLRLELLPRFLFPLNQFPAQSTETRKQTLNPKWNQSFQIAVPDELFFMNGACLCISVLDYDVIGHNDLAGQAFLPLAGLPRLKDLSIRCLPPPRVLALQLPDPARHSVDPAFQILEQRSARRDSLAKEMTGYEKYLRDYRILPPSSLDDKEWTLRAEWRRGRHRIGRLFPAWPPYARF